MSSSRIRNKVYKYAVFFFPDGKKVGTCKTSNVCEGFKDKIKEGEVVLLDWEGRKVQGKIIILHGKCCFSRMLCLRSPT